MDGFVLAPANQLRSTHAQRSHNTRIPWVLDPPSPQVRRAECHPTADRPSQEPQRGLLRRFVG